jgi:hypothetical protein
VATAFRLAPMTRDMRVMTGVALVLPLWLLGAALASPPPVRGVLVGTVAFVLLLYAATWLFWRPSRFEVDAAALRIVWPLRSRVVPRRLVTGVASLTAAELRARHGVGVRIGVGGLWGGFGLLKTRTTTFSLWVSRTDRMVLVDIAGARPLLLTPEDPERFVAVLGR